MERFDANQGTWPKKLSEAIFFVSEFLIINENSGKIYLSKRSARYIANVIYLMQSKHMWFRKNITIVFTQFQLSGETGFYMTIEQNSPKELGKKQGYKTNPCIDCKKFYHCPKVLGGDVKIFDYHFIRGVQAFNWNPGKNSFFIKECDSFIKDDKRVFEVPKGE